MSINYLAIVVAALLSTVVSFLYYAFLNRQITSVRAAAAKAIQSKKADIRTTITPNKIIVELTRMFILGLVLAYACGLLGITSLQQAAFLSFWLWIGFPVVLLTGLVTNERFPARLAVLHAGDWLLRLLIFTCLLSVWHEPI